MVFWSKMKYITEKQKTREALILLEKSVLPGFSESGEDGIRTRTIFQYLCGIAASVGNGFGKRAVSAGCRREERPGETARDGSGRVRDRVPVDAFHHMVRLVAGQLDDLSIRQLQDVMAVGHKEMPTVMQPETLAFRDACPLQQMRKRVRPGMRR